MLRVLLHAYLFSFSTWIVCLISRKRSTKYLKMEQIKLANSLILLQVTIIFQQVLVNIVWEIVPLLGSS